MRPYILAKFAISFDGYLDDANPERLLISTKEDLDQVDQVRTYSDAILVGANTVRKDNPRLLVRSSARREKRKRHGWLEDPIKMTVTESGNLSQDANFFHTGNGQKLVYCPTLAATDLRNRLRQSAKIIPVGESKVDFSEMFSDAYFRGIKRILVEGGVYILQQILDQDLVDELQISIAHFRVDNPSAPKIFGDKTVTGDLNGYLKECRQLGDMLTLLIYRGRNLTSPHFHYLQKALDLSRQCPPSKGAYSVGAVLVGKNGKVLATGFSREIDPSDHAEEVAIRRAKEKNYDLRGCTLYTTMEPCAQRRSRPKSCASQIIEAGISEVYFAAKEPEVFVHQPQGCEVLSHNGIQVSEIDQLASFVLEVNEHLFVPQAALE